MWLCLKTGVWEDEQETPNNFRDDYAVSRWQKKWQGWEDVYPNLNGTICRGPMGDTKKDNTIVYMCVLNQMEKELMT